MALRKGSRSQVTSVRDVSRGEPGSRSDPSAWNRGRLSKRVGIAKDLHQLSHSAAKDGTRPWGQ